MSAVPSRSVYTNGDVTAPLAVFHELGNGRNKQMWEHPWGDECVWCPQEFYTAIERRLSRG